jgi:hypothetical protein
MTGEIAIYQRRNRKYWMKKLKMKSYNACNIDWEVGEKSSKTLTKPSQKWLAKWNTGICRVGIQLKRWKHQDHNKCPRCEQDREYVSHIMKCQHLLATMVWEEVMTKLKEWMDKNKCESRMKTTILESLHS